VLAARLNRRRVLILSLSKWKEEHHDSLGGKERSARVVSWRGISERVRAHAYSSSGGGST